MINSQFFNGIKKSHTNIKMDLREDMQSSLIKTTVDKLINGQLICQNRFHTLLIGNNAQSYLNWIEQSYNKNVSIIRCTTDRLLYYDLLDHINFSLLQNKYTWNKEDRNSGYAHQELIEHLETHDMNLIILIPNLERIFTNAWNKEECNNFIRDIKRLTSSASGRVYVCASSKSEHIAQLCFSKSISDEIRPLFPNYTGIDLNSAKLQPVWL
jgi:hypothetical protein